MSKTSDDKSSNDKPVTNIYNYYSYSITDTCNNIINGFFTVNVDTQKIINFYELSNGNYIDILVDPIMFNEPEYNYSPRSRDTGDILVNSQRLAQYFNYLPIQQYGIMSLISYITFSSRFVLERNTSYFISQFTIRNINAINFNINNLTEPPLIPISNICFPSGTPVNTDNGIINIEKLNPYLHTIRGNKIETITKTVTQDKYIVCIEKDALAKNIPSEKTIISKNHKLFYNGSMVPSKKLLELNNTGIYKVKYTGEILYNILLEDKLDKMIVNNLICESLDPENNIAKMYYEMKNANLDFEKHQQYIKLYNNYVKENKTFTK